MKTVLKRLFSILLVVCMVSMAACGTSEHNSDYPTNKSVSFNFIDYKEFNKFWTDGIYKCGTDFPAGDYYIMSIFDANAENDVSNDPNDFYFSEYRVLRKVSVSKGQYVNISHGGLLVSCGEIKENNLIHYGIFLIGKDLPEGEYKIQRITDVCDLELDNSFNGICGAYQISEGRPENEPIDSAILFENQTYITLKNGQYITINDAELTLVD